MLAVGETRPWRPAEHPAPERRRCRRLRLVLAHQHAHREGDPLAAARWLRCRFAHRRMRYVRELLSPGVPELVEVAESEADDPVIREVGGEERELRAGARAQASMAWLDLSS